MLRGWRSWGTCTWREMRPGRSTIKKWLMRTRGEKVFLILPKCFHFWSSGRRSQRTWRRERGERSTSWRRRRWRQSASLLAGTGTSRSSGRLRCILYFLEDTIFQASGGEWSRCHWEKATFQVEPWRGLLFLRKRDIQKIRKTNSPDQTWHADLRREQGEGWGCFLCHCWNSGSWRA